MANRTTTSLPSSGHMNNESIRGHQQATQPGHKPAAHVIMILFAISFFFASFNIQFVSFVGQYITFLSNNEQQTFRPPNDSVTAGKFTRHSPITTKKQRQDNLDKIPRDSVHRVAFVTFSYVKHNDTHKLFNFLLAAVDTWAAPPPDDTINEVRPPLYVVFSEVSREPFEEICIHGHGNITLHQRALCQRLHPIYVDCPESGAGEGPCCKQQKGLASIIQSKYPLYDWYTFMDDDVYLRKEYVAKLLAQLQPPTFPMAAIPYNQDAKPLGWMNSRCGRGNEEFSYPWQVDYSSTINIFICRIFSLIHHTFNFCDQLKGGSLYFIHEVQLK